jgi:DNA invertase Pin-like site-specific DNA recombinase
MKTKRAAIYLRVSTDGQTTENQRRELVQVAAVAGWDVVEFYEDAGISGAKGRDKRPSFDRLCNDATKRRFDVVMTWSVDRLGRSLQDLVNFLGDLKALKVDLFILKQGLDTTTPTGEAMFQMVGVFAQFERAMIRERVNAGLARAKAQGKTLGRPKMDSRIKAAIQRGKADGMSIRAIAAKVGVSVGAVHKVVAEPV